MSVERRVGVEPSGEVPMPRPRVMGMTGAAMVGVAALVLLAVSARLTIVPATPVVVTPVVLDSSGENQPESPGMAQLAGRTVQAPGWLEAEPFYVSCSALADGVVREVLALEGDRVEAGQVVARLVDDEARLAVDRARAELARAQAAAAIARADYQAAQTDWEEPVELERMAATTRASLDEARAELAQLPSLIDAERARLERIEEELTRAEASYGSGGAANIELIVLRKSKAAQAAIVAGMEAKRPMLEAQVARREAEAKAAERALGLRVALRRSLEATRAGVEAADAEVALARARLADAELRLQRMEVRAPITGYVQARLKAPGDKAMLGMDDPASAQVLRLYDPQRLQVRVDVPLSEASQVRVGQKCEVVVEVLPDQTFRGEVLRIVHEADIQKNTLQVKVRVLDPSPMLRPEMLTRVKFLADGRDSAGSARLPDGPTLMVRSTAVTRRDGSRGEVLAVRDRRGAVGRTERVHIEVVGERGGWLMVRGGLTPGDLLVEGSEGMGESSRVRVAAVGHGGGQ